MKTSELPSFFDVVDGHKLVRGGDFGDGQTGIADLSDVPSARDWVDSLQSRWAGDAMEAGYVAPLAQIVGRVAALSGVEAPALDLSEQDQATVRMAEGFDPNG